MKNTHIKTGRICINMGSRFLGKAFKTLSNLQESFDRVHENGVKKRKLLALISVTLLVLNVLLSVW